jgi:hypothetical protein
MATNQPSSYPQPPIQVGAVRNMGEPLRFTNVQPLAGFVKDVPAPGQQTVNVLTRVGLTSDERLFHRVVEGFDRYVRGIGDEAGLPVGIRAASLVLLVMHPDRSAELWIDKAAVAFRCLVKRPMANGIAVFENDIADVISMYFPAVSIGVDDKVVCVFREGWSFGLVAFTNEQEKLDVEEFYKALGSLHRGLRYREVYDAVLTPATFEPLLTAGWFPFVEIVNAEFRDFASQAEAGHPLDAAEQRLLQAFDAQRLDHLVDRWMTKPHLAARDKLLVAAVNAFKNGDAVSTIKNVLTEIEGVLNDAYRSTHGGQGAKLKVLLPWVRASAEGQAGSPDTLLFPEAFARYLDARTFANFDPINQTGEADSRHAVGHGAAYQDSYTMTRALQAILTLDQIAFYT